MFAKVCAVILAVGVTACGLLALRQARLQAAHELARTQLRIRALDEDLWAMRARIAAKVTPGTIEQMAAGVGQLRPMIEARPAAEIRQAEAENSATNPRSATPSAKPPASKPPAAKPGTPPAKTRPVTPVPTPGERRWAEAIR